MGAIVLDRFSFVDRIKRLAGIVWCVYGLTLLGAGCSPVTRSTPLVDHTITSTLPAVTDHALRMRVVGDIMLDRNVARRTRAAGTSTYPFARLPAGWLGEADLTIGNLEGPVTPTRLPPEKSIDFQFDPSVVDVLRQQGFDFVSQANNHALDQGSRGFEDSWTRLLAGGVIPFGHQVRDDEIALATTTVRGVRLAFAGFNTTDNPIHESDAGRVLAIASSTNDLVVAFMHWGAEYQDHPTQDVQTRARWLIDHGADLVIGGHPHWTQGVDEYKGKLIVYSLGNFIFDQDFSDETRQGLALDVVIHRDQVCLVPHPIWIEASQPMLETGEKRMTRMQALTESSYPSVRADVGKGYVCRPR